MRTSLQSAPQRRPTPPNAPFRSTTVTDTGISPARERLLHSQSRRARTMQRLDGPLEGASSTVPAVENFE